MSEKLNFAEVLKAVNSLESDKRVSKEIVLDSLKDALQKAYRRQVRADDINLDVIIDETNKKEPIKMYQVYNVVAQDEDITDYDLQMELEEAVKLDPTATVGGTVRSQVDLSECGRAAAVLAKNVMKQKIREAEKMVVYNQYKDRVGDMVTGVIEAIEPKYMMINLGDALALMPKTAQLPTEYYREGEHLRVVITQCQKDTKGSQLLVSRSDAMLVKRLFEKDVPEIYQGIVEIKLIARDPGERTKMAVLSHNPDVDAVGTCIGLQGNRIAEVSAEIHGERIDVFEYSDDIVELVRNALKPAVVISAVPTADKKGVLVVVDPSQLSLAIGKKGKNVKLVAHLLEKRVDIKTFDQLQSEGIDFYALEEQYKADLEKEKRLKSAEVLAQMQAEAQAAKEAAEAAVQSVEEPVDEEPVFDKDEKADLEAEEENAKKNKKSRHTLRERSEYVSVFETFADSSRAKEEEAKAAASKKKKKKSDESERKLNNADLVGEKEYSLKPFYTDEELEEIEAEFEENEYDDIDYDEYAEYYEDDQD